MDSSRVTTITLSKSRIVMSWTAQHDILFVREILFQKPWTKRSGSVERGQLWDQIAATLNSLEVPEFKVAQRSVRDRYTLLSKRYKKKWADEEKASCISPIHIEIDEALLDIIQQFDEADQIRVLEGEIRKAEVSKAQEIRKVSLETFTETKKRQGESGEGQSKRSRKSSGDAIASLTDKANKDFELRERELKLREDALKLKEQSQNVQLQLMQQQNIAMMELIKKISK